MIGIMLEHDFMIKQSICDTFVLAKRGFSGSGQMLLNTLNLQRAAGQILEGLRTRLKGTSGFSSVVGHPQVAPAAQKKFLSILTQNQEILHK